MALIRPNWSRVCGEQMTLYNQVLPEFRKHEAELLGISVDGAWCHEAFAKDRHLPHFPLLADFEPKGDVARRYGAYRPGEGVCEWALFLIDRKGADFGAIFRQSPSIPARTAFLMRWKNSQPR